MPIEVHAHDSSSQIASAISQAIVDAIPGARVEVSPGGTGHFEIRVETSAFEGLGRVGQQRLVYGAIAPLMGGSNPPVHAVDRLQCVIP